jgi:hypothetical protein
LLFLNPEKNSLFRMTLIDCANFYSYNLSAALIGIFVACNLL